MKRAGKYNKSLEGKDPLERASVDYYGDNVDQGFAQFIGACAKIFDHEKESAHGKRLARLWLKDTILPLFEREFRRALTAADGTFFHKLARHLDRFRKPIDPLRSWVATLFYREANGRGDLRKSKQHHWVNRKTSRELLTLFHAAYPKDAGELKKDAEELKAFLRVLREFGVKWKKSPVGRRARKARGTR